jgi:dolichol-phosphate mannosyltransferase
MDPTVSLSVIVPAHNERDNVAPLLLEIEAALTPLDLNWEALFIDDASRDDTLAVLRSLQSGHKRLRVLRHHRQSGQSTAVRTGVKAARGTWIATLDGDGQNDPADIPKLLAARNAGPDEIKLYAGWRTTRRDSFSKRISSRVANGIRAFLLKDDTPDTGCGIKLFEREVFLDLPYFDHMHRFLPALVRRAGFGVQSVPVNHRPRMRGISKYGLWNRLWVGIVDIAGVAWLRRRAKPTAVSEEHP